MCLLLKRKKIENKLLAARTKAEEMREFLALLFDLLLHASSFRNPLSLFTHLKRLIALLFPNKSDRKSFFLITCQQRKILHIIFAFHSRNSS